MTQCRVRRVSFLGDKFDDTVSGEYGVIIGDKFDDTVSGEKGIIFWRQV